MSGTHNASSLGFLGTQGCYHDGNKLNMQSNYIIQLIYSASSVCVRERVRESSEGDIIKAFQLKVRQFINAAFLNFKS